MQAAQKDLNDAFKALELNPAAAAVVGTKEMLDASQFALNSAMYSKIISAIIFGIFPLLFFIRNVCVKKDNI